MKRDVLKMPRQYFVKKSSSVKAPKKILFLVSGKAQHGKDTFADGLVKYVADIRRDGVTFIKKSYAAGIKDIAHSLGWDGKKDVKGRAFLQAIGNGARKYDENVWVKKLLRELEHETSSSNPFPPFVVIPDCRHPNEIEVSKAWGELNGYDVHIVRIERPHFDNGLSDEAKVHVSEVALDDYPFDFKLYNDYSSVEDFQKDSFGKWLDRYPHVVPSLTASWDTGKGISIIHGNDMQEIADFRNSEPTPLVTIDFDDTLMEKTGLVNRVPFFSCIQKAGAKVVVVTARSSRIDDITEFVREHNIPIRGIVFNAGSKGHVLDILRPLCHFDDDPRVAEDAFRTCVPIFTMGEFSSPEYQKKWIESIDASGEREFYVMHSNGVSLEDIVRGKGALMTQEEIFPAENGLSLG